MKGRKPRGAQALKLGSDARRRKRLRIKKGGVGSACGRTASFFIRKRGKEIDKIKDRDRGLIPAIRAKERKKSVERHSCSKKRVKKKNSANQACGQRCHDGGGARSSGGGGTTFRPPAQSEEKESNEMLKKRGRSPPG